MTLKMYMDINQLISIHQYEITCCKKARWNFNLIVVEIKETQKEIISFLHIFKYDGKNFSLIKSTNNC